MKKEPMDPLDGEVDEMLDEYDFTVDDIRNAPRGQYADRYARGTNVVLLDSDVVEMFPNSDAVNQALRALATIIREREKVSAG